MERNLVCCFRSAHFLLKAILTQVKYPSFRKDAFLQNHEGIMVQGLCYHTSSFMDLILFVIRRKRSVRLEGEGEVMVFNAKHWERRNRADLIEYATPCNDAQVARPYRVSNRLRLTVLASESEDYTTTPQYLHLHLHVWRT